MLSKSFYFDTPVSVFIVVRFVLGLTLFLSLPWLIFMYEETIHGYINLVVVYLVWSLITKAVVKYLN